VIPHLCRIPSTARRCTDGLRLSRQAESQQVRPRREGGLSRHPFRIRLPAYRVTRIPVTILSSLKPLKANSIA
jgi:hypothetical protein